LNIIEVRDFDIKRQKELYLCLFCIKTGFVNGRKDQTLATIDVKKPKEDEQIMRCSYT